MFITWRTFFDKLGNSLHECAGAGWTVECTVDRPSCVHSQNGRRALDIAKAAAEGRLCCRTPSDHVRRHPHTATRVFQYSLLVHLDLIRGWGSQRRCRDRAVDLLQLSDPLMEPLNLVFLYLRSCPCSPLLPRTFSRWVCSMRALVTYRLGSITFDCSDRFSRQGSATKHLCTEAAHLCGGGKDYRLLPPSVSSL